MNVDQHLKVAQWHTEQARLHAVGGHSCGCPANPHDQKAIDAIEAMHTDGLEEQIEESCGIPA